MIPMVSDTLLTPVALSKQLKQLDSLLMTSRQFIATVKPAGWSPQKVVNSKVILPKMV